MIDSELSSPASAGDIVTEFFAIEMRLQTGSAWFPVGGLYPPSDRKLVVRRLNHWKNNKADVRISKFLRIEE